MLFRFRYIQQQGLLHTYIRVFAGRTEASLGLCGSLTMRNEEWEIFRAFMEAGNQAIALATDSKVEFLLEHPSTTVY